MVLKKIFSILIVLTCATIALHAQSPSLDFVKQFGSTGRDDVQAMTTDASGNIYLTGRYNGTVDFDPGAGVTNLTASGTSADMYVLKLDAAGNFIWARSMGGSSTDSGSGIAVDTDGSVYTISSVNAPFDADPGAGVFNLGGDGTDDIGVIKLDASGNFVWAIRVGGNQSDLPSDIAIDGTGNLYITGGYESDNLDFDPGAGTFLMSSNDLFDAFILKLSSSGTFIWARKAGGAASDFSSQISLDSDGNVIAIGNYSSTIIDFDPGAANFNMSAVNGSIFLWKLNPAGDFVWARQTHGEGARLALDTDNNFYVTGWFQSTRDFDPGSGVVNLTSKGDRDVYVSKLAADGSHIWSRSFGGTSGDYPQWIGVDASRNVYLSGYFFGTTDLDPGTGNYAFTAGARDIWFSKLDPGGNLLFAYTAGGSGDDLVAKSVLLTSGEILSAPYFENVVDFNPGSGTTNLTSAGSYDIALQKISQTPLTGPTITGFTPTSGMAGATVTISGTNFSSIIANNTVQFNGTTATITVATLNSLTVTVPPGATTGPITVTVGAQTATSATSFTVIPTPVITFTTQPADQAVCPDAEVTLSAVATGTSGLTYRWQKFDANTSAFVDLANGGGYSGVTTTTLTLALESGATIGDYRVRVNGTSAAETYSDVSTITTVTPPPAPSAPDVSADGSCGPVAVTLTATSTGSGEFRWYNNQNLNFFESAETAGTYTTMPLGGASTYHVSFFDGTCESAKTVINISVDYDGPGSRDISFNTPANCPGCNSFLDYVVKQPDGKLLTSNIEIGGTEYKLVRIMPDGTLDPAFTVWPDAEFVGNANPIGLLPDGKIILGGSFTSIDGNTLRRIARFNTNGTLDLTFNSGSGFNNTVSEILIQPDGKILVTGTFTSYNGTAVSRLVRLNMDGTIDNTFTPGTGPSGSIEALHVQPDNKILIGGGFTAYNGMAMPQIARLNTDGTLDASFTPASGLRPFEIVAQSDGKILVGGDFTTVGGLPRLNIARLNSDGTVDPTFDPGAGADDWIYAIYQEPSGKILIGGWLENYDGTPRNFIARLYPDGKLDPFFDAGVGSFTLVTNIIPYDNNFIYIGGYISHWNDQELNGVVRVNNECIRTPSAENVSTCSSAVTLNACGGADGQYRWYTGPTGGTAIAGETSSALNVSNITADVTYYVTLADQICESSRVPVTITYNPSSVTPPSTTGATACAGNSVILNAAGTTDGNYRWYSAASGGSSISGAVNSQYTTPVLGTTTTYFVSIVSSGCESTRTPVQATIQPIPAAPGAANVTTCAQTAFSITATGFPNGDYRWYDASDVLIPGETSGTLNVASLTLSTQYYVTGITNNCESSKTMINVTVDECNDNTAPAISTGILTTQIGGLVSIDLTSIITDPDGNLDLTSVVIINQPASGAIATIENNTLLIDYSARTFSGTDVLTIRACDNAGSCTDAEIVIEVIGDVIVYNAVSPNDDGLNDFFRLEYIDVIEDTRENTVMIYNRWGDVVFEVSNYDNVSRVFNGRNKNGNKLPPGTYFYVIKFSSGREGKQGYLEMRY